MHNARRSADAVNPFTDTASRLTVPAARHGRRRGQRRDSRGSRRAAPRRCARRLRLSRLEEDPSEPSGVLGAGVQAAGRSRSRTTRSCARPRMRGSRRSTPSFESWEPRSRTTMPSSRIRPARPDTRSRRARRAAGPPVVLLCSVSAPMGALAHGAILVARNRDFPDAGNRDCPPVGRGSRRRVLRGLCLPVVLPEFGVEVIQTAERAQ